MRRAAAFAAVLAVVGVAATLGVRLLDDDPSDAPVVGDRTFSEDDPVARACALPKELLVRLWRGHDPDHSEDVTTVPLEPNYSGTFSITSHSGPWDYLQNVPLVFYGPGIVEAGGTRSSPASLADVYPTMARLLDADLPPRTGRDLVIAAPGAPLPKLIVVVVWDGAGRNMLERWPDAWPELARLEREGTSFFDAVVGSSPSITPATHSTLGTGTYPRQHGVTAISFRDDDGRVRNAFANKDPRDLELSTWADEFDIARGNEPIVGMLAWKSWHLGMMGHGAAHPDGDHDELVLINTHGNLAGNPDLYSFPDIGMAGLLEEKAGALDRSDGAADGKWRGHEILGKHDNPAWVDYQSDLLLRMLEQGDYGRDDVPDLFFTNFKITDIAAHQYTMDGPETRDALAAQDRALGRLVEWLDTGVGDYVVLVTADHGHTPAATRSGAWPILQGQLQDDIDAHFGVTEGSLVDTTSAAGPFLDAKALEREGVTTADVARFLNGYTIAENWNDDRLPEGYEHRGDENVFAAAWPSRDYRAVMRCATGTAGAGAALPRS